MPVVFAEKVLVPGSVSGKVKELRTTGNCFCWFLNTRRLWFIVISHDVLDLIYVSTPVFVSVLTRESPYQLPSLLDLEFPNRRPKPFFQYAYLLIKFKFVSQCTFWPFLHFGNPIVPSIYIYFRPRNPFLRVQNNLFNVNETNRNVWQFCNNKDVETPG